MSCGAGFDASDCAGRDDRARLCSSICCLHLTWFILGCELGRVVARCFSPAPVQIVPRLCVIVSLLHHPWLQSNNKESVPGLRAVCCFRAHTLQVLYLSSLHLVRLVTHFSASWLHNKS